MREKVPAESQFFLPADPLHGFSPKRDVGAPWLQERLSILLINPGNDLQAFQLRQYPVHVVIQLQLSIFDTLQDSNRSHELRAWCYREYSCQCHRLRAVFWLSRSDAHGSAILECTWSAVLGIFENEWTAQHEVYKPALFAAIMMTPGRSPDSQAASKDSSKEDILRAWSSEQGVNRKSKPRKWICLVLKIVQQLRHEPFKGYFESGCHKDCSKLSCFMI